MLIPTNVGINVWVLALGFWAFTVNSETFSTPYKGGDSANEWRLGS